MGKALVAGIDVGAHNVSAVLLGPNGVLGHAILASAEEGERAARRSLEDAIPPLNGWAGPRKTMFFFVSKRIQR